MFYLWVAGRCPSPLTTETDCAAAAATLPVGNDFTPPLPLRNTDSSYEPPFCSLTRGYDDAFFYQLVFNTHEVGGDCSGYRMCLCKEPPPSPYEGKLLLDLSYGADAINMTLVYSADSPFSSPDSSLNSPSISINSTFATSWTSGAELSATYTDAWFADEAHGTSVGEISRRGEAHFALTHTFADAEERAELRAWLDPSPLTHLPKDLWTRCAEVDQSTFIPSESHPQILASSYLLGDVCGLADKWVPNGGLLLKPPGLEPMELAVSLEHPFFEFLSPVTDPPFYKGQYGGQQRMLSVRRNSIHVSGASGSDSIASTTTYSVGFPCECKDSWEMPSFFALTAAHTQSCSGQQSGCSNCLADGDETSLLARFCEVKNPICSTSGLQTLIVPSTCANNDLCTSEWGNQNTWATSDGVCDE